MPPITPVRGVATGRSQYPHDTTIPLAQPLQAAPISNPRAKRLGSAHVPSSSPAVLGCMRCLLMTPGVRLCSSSSIAFAAVLPILDQGIVLQDNRILSCSRDHRQQVVFVETT